ncbi:hypothetical protein BGY98DRAFT_1176465 [Russula aff. rugulosa BPL654]|nr:hypothetical protein BGY98DRAFT_1176465 [Russula aff. rugulosa BPL654]
MTIERPPPSSVESAPIQPDHILDTPRSPPSSPTKSSSRIPLQITPVSSAQVPTSIGALGPHDDIGDHTPVIPMTALHRSIQTAMPAHDVVSNALPLEGRNNIRTVNYSSALETAERKVAAARRNCGTCRSAPRSSIDDYWDREREELVEQAIDQIVIAADGLRVLVQRFDIPLFSRGSGVSVLVDALGRYLEKHNAQVLYMGHFHQSHLPKTQPASSRYCNHFGRHCRPKARAARLSNAARPFRAGNDRILPNLRMGAPGSRDHQNSISNMDVTPGGGYAPSGAGVNGGGHIQRISVAQRVQALISDDRVLMERLIRFAQAHDSLQSGAQRVQKLAQESNAALETYQTQVRRLEEHPACSDGMKEQLAAEKLATEERAAKQAETLGELTEANLQLALLEEINLVQTENGNLRKKLHALEKL